MFPAATKSFELRSDSDVVSLLEIVCFGRPYSVEQVWAFMEAEEIDELVKGEATIFSLMGDLDRAEAKLQILGVNNERPFPVNRSTVISEEHLLNVRLD